MTEQNILAVDVGTSEVKAALISYRGEIRDCARSHLELLHPEPTWAEQNPEGWWQAITSAVRKLWERAPNRRDTVTGLVFSCQMFGVLPVDVDGKPLMNAMIWLDTRSREQARAMTHGFPKISGYGLGKVLKWLRETNGAPNLAGRDTISKYIWLREERPELWSQTAKLLDVKDYLLLRTTGRTVTTYDLASGGWLFKTKRGDLGWSDPILKMLNFDAKRLPTVLRSTEVAGPLQDDAAADLGIPAGTPVIAGAGDVPSCAVGSGAVRNEEVHICLGTSSWVAAHRDNRCVDPFSATGTLCAAEFGQYILIATQETAGASMEWLRQNLLGPDLDYPEINELIQQSAPGAGGIHFFPWMMGERVPVDDSSVRGGFVNLSLDHTQADVLRSVLEGVAFNTRWAFEVVQKLLGSRVPSVRITGGGAQSDPWCQIMADVLGRPVHRVANPQFCGVRGAALIALRALGEISNLDETAALVEAPDTFEPNPKNVRMYDSRYGAYRDFYKRNHSWFRRLNEGRSRK